MGAIGRVFASGEPEMSHDVQQYGRSLYIRVGEAKRCRVRASLFMPLFSNPAREGQPAAVFEVAQSERDVLFPALIDSLSSCLQVGALLSIRVLSNIDAIVPTETSTALDHNHSTVQAALCHLADVAVLLQGTGLHTADARMHAMAVGLHGVGGSGQLPASAPQKAGAAAQQPPQFAAGLQDEAAQPQQAASLVALSEAHASAGQVEQEEEGGGAPAGQQAASATRSDNNSSESIQTTRATQ